MSDALVQTAIIQNKAQAGGGFGSVPSAPLPSLPTSLTLSGAGFEAITNPKPSAWDDFSGYTGLVDGDTIPKTGNDNWDNVGGSSGSGYKLNSAKALGGQDFCIESIGKKSYLSVLKPRVDGQPINNDFLYVSWYFQSNEKLGASNQIGSVSDKLLRVWDENTGLGMRTSWLATTQGYNTNSRFRYYDQSPFIDEENQWHRLEMSVDDTGAVAKQKFWIDGLLAGEIVDLDVTGTQTALNNSQKINDPSRPWGSAPMKGCIVYNITDGSEGKIQNDSDVNGDEITVTGLSGGTNNEFNVGDQYRITGFVGHLPSAGEKEFFVALIGYDPSIPENLNDLLRHFIAGVNQYPSYARVELSNSIAFDDSVKQKRVLQKTLSRTDTEIVIPEVFFGELDIDTPIYAHVIRSDGTILHNVAGDIR